MILNPMSLVLHETDKKLSTCGFDEYSEFKDPKQWGLNMFVGRG